MAARARESLSCRPLRPLTGGRGFVRGYTLVSAVYCREDGVVVLHGFARVGLGFSNVSQLFNIPSYLTQSSLRWARTTPTEAHAGSSCFPHARRVLLHGRLEAEARQEGAPFGELRLELVLDCQSMVGYPAGVVVFDLLFELEDAATELEVLGEHAGALVFQLADAQSADVVRLGEVSVLAEELLANWQLKVRGRHSTITAQRTGRGAYASQCCPKTPGVR